MYVWVCVGGAVENAVNFEENSDYSLKTSVYSGGHIIGSAFMKF